MKKLILLLAILCAWPVAAQRWIVGDSASYTVVGVGAPAASACANVSHVGRMYSRRDGATTFGTFYLCGNTGLGTYAWEGPYGTGTPGGADTSIQFNNGGAFGGFGTWNGTTFNVPSGLLAGFTNIPYLSPTATTTFQPAADVGYIFKCYNGTNTAAIFSVQDKNGDNALNYNCNTKVWTWGIAGSTYQLASTAGTVNDPGGSLVSIGLQSTGWGQRAAGGSFDPFLRVSQADDLYITRPGGISSSCTGWPSGCYFKHEDWVLGGAVCTTAGRTCGEGGHWWLSTGTTGTMAQTANELNHPGLRTIRSGATTNNAVELQWTAAFGSMAWSNIFDAIYVVRPENSDTDTLHRFGLMNDAGTNPPTDGIYMEKLAADTNWFLVCRAASTETRVDTAIAHATTYMTVRFRRVDATTIARSFCSGDGCTLGAEVNVTTNCPTAATEARAGFYVRTAANAAKGLVIDYSDLLITGIVR